ncbi:protein-L-isoaspartate O-methyltransferase [Methylobacterium sp. Leaf469]|uniref:protein-L-isoaspartate O-methyltransferase family protein n=1 Tax=unclassified Methylobacterium TaxID=2615210 RepID=UPI0006F66D50|nr:MULTISPECIES: protein-L-isoaspartate O-methyltransferase [unclassified Methylobacterium]USU31973.1 protein-L-isoaspartate O-methyltransferase [Methylobacterium sp. OTU13CASTA1]KQO72018.1 protein-L-isoaspartate O-methyltransferase [Methylobacterium sp. Leaf87]KQP25038.1 protein-L-isoaspartate O-methyltransferase [Methylobacterium sp. Leaf102]KQP29079.1 protein-L-isoaspartate O-methyltransferase [Methylobacterium sp. Leaf100]KQP65206.1 protein-L-isoaspartate O-methyltransferase [Methylobacter
MLDYAQARRLMVDCQLRTFDVNSVPVLDAFEDVARERFVPPGREDFAYIDQTLTLDGGGGDVRAMPAPMLLARMIQALDLKAGAKALDVGTGYGYAAAILHHLGAEVVALESSATLAAGARERLGGLAGTELVEAPLEAGAPASGPYDGILVNGRVEVRPQALLEQLKEGGRLVCVIGQPRAAKATLFVRTGDAYGARPLFDATLPVLGPFAAANDFAF